MTDEVWNPFRAANARPVMMHLRHITYFTWLDEELVTVPNFPAWVCDMCGRREYDASAISWLVTILNPETGKASSPKRRPPQPLKKRNQPAPPRNRVLERIHLTGIRGDGKIRPLYCPAPIV